MRPCSVSFTPTLSRPSPSTSGRRPMLTSTISACRVSAAPPFAGSTVRVTPDAGRLRLGDLRAQLELQSLPGERTLELPGDLVIDPGRDAIEELDHRHLRAQPPPDRAQLEADDARADHDEVLGHLGQARARRSTTRSSSRRRRRRAAASPPEPEAIRMFLAASVSLTAPSSPRTTTEPALSMRPVPWKAVILFFLNRKATPLVVASTTSPLRFISWAKSSLGGPSTMPWTAEVVARLLEQMRGLQQRLGRDAADIEAGAAEGGALLDHRHLHAELGGADRRHIAARTGADHDKVEACVGHDAAPHTPSSSRSGSSMHSLTRTRNSTASRPSMMRWS